MKKSVDLSQLELNVKQELKENKNITVEISGLPEGEYGTLANVFDEEGYEVRGIVNVLGVDGDNRKSRYILHIRGCSENA